MVAAILQKLVEQIAVRAVNVDAIEAGCLRILRAAAKGFDDAGNLFERERPRRDEVLFRPEQRDVAACGNRGRSYGKLTVQKDGIGDASDVPDLREDAAPGVVDGACDGLPCLGLLLGPDAGTCA